MSILSIIVLLTILNIIIWKVLYSLVDSIRDVRIRLIDIEHKVECIKHLLDDHKPEKKILMIEKKVAANRRPRTEDEKRRTSEARKEWWKKKREQDALALQKDN